MQASKLTLDETKTRTCDATQEPFDFLGYSFGPMAHRPTGLTYVGAQAVTAGRGQFPRTGAGHSTTSRNQDPWPEVLREARRRGWRLAALFLVRDCEPGVLEPGQVPAVPTPVAS